MDTQVLVFHESSLSPWAQSRRTRLEDASPRFHTVGSLDAVNTQVAAAGLQKRTLLPSLVVDYLEPMPPKRRVVAGGVSRSQVRHKPRNGGGGGGEHGVAAVEKDKPTAVNHGRETPKASLIEMATYPGYTPSSPTPLPHSLDTLEQMRRVTRAQAKLAAKRQGYREYWRENFYSPASQTVFLDTFWWFFLERYQPHRTVQSSLFSRVSENYVKFLMKTEIHTWKDKFLKAYPDAIAQCVYTAFIHAFPASWSSFDTDFKSALVELVHLWQTGTRPMPELWKRWNFEYLDPPNSLKTIGEEDRSPRPHEKKFNLEALVEEAREVGEGRDDLTPSINGPQLTRASVETSSTPSKSHTPNHSQQNIVSRTELEQVLSGRLIEDPTRDTLLSPQSGKMDVARTQYLRLRQRQKRQTTQSPPHSLQRGKTAPRPETMSSRKPVKPAGPHCLNKPPPPPPPPLANESPIHTAKADLSRSIGRRQYKMTRKEKALQPQEKVCQPQLVAATVGERGKGGEVAAGKERLCGNLKPSIGREEMGGRKVVTENGNGRKKITASEKKRALNGEKISQCQKSQCPQQQPARQPPHPERIPGQPPTPPPATKKDVGSCKPASRAEEYGLPNYVFEEGGKEKTWKDKAINVREKSEQRPITILHKLHHQGTPLAVPETESVCFNVFGRSPLVKHYLQQRRLTKVTGYTLLTKRTEINQVIPSGAPTYDDVIQESLRENKERSVLLASQKRQTKKHLQKILQDRLKRRDTYKQQLHHLLSAPKEVESLSNELLTYWEQRGVGRQQGLASLRHTLSPDMQRNIATCINRALQSCSARQQTSPQPH